MLPIRPVLAFSAVLLLLAGCNRSDRKTIGVIPKATSHLFWQTVQAGAMKAGHDLHVNIEWNGAATESDFSRQIQILDSMIARRLDGIAVAASDRDALNSSLARAAQLKVPVTVFDSAVESEDYLSFVSTNNFEAGQLAGRKLGQLLNGKGRVIMTQHMPGSRSTMDRERGFEDVIGREFPGIRIVARQFGMSDRSKSMAATENMLTANPDAEGLFASSENSSTGAAQAVKSRGRGGKIRFVAFDAGDNLVDDLKAGVIDALIAQDPFKMGFQAVATLVDKLHGKTPPKRMDLSAVVVTKDDLSRPDIQALLFPDIHKYLK